MRRLRHLLSLVLGPSVLLTGLICAAAAGCAQLGRTNDLWDLLTHFAVIWLAGAAVALLAGLVFVGWVRPALIIVGLAGVILSGALMAPEYRRDAGETAPADAPRQLKLIQFNVWGDENRSLDQTVAWIAAQDADVVAVEESNSRVRALIQAKTGMHVACGDCEVSIFSRAAPTSIEVPGRPDNASGAAVARASFRDARGDYTVMAAHPPWPTPNADQQYEGQVLARVLDRFDRPSLILAGDFNSASWSFSRRREDDLYGLIRRDRGLLSWPGRLKPSGRSLVPTPVLPIDHVYAGQDWATVKVERGPRLGSDHYPLVVTLARRGPP